jgi:hypothetical protein
MNGRGYAALTVGCGLVVAAAALHGGCTAINTFAPLADEQDHGVIVVGGTLASDGPDEYVLTALDTQNGKELDHAQRKNMTVAGVQYSGREDVWYVFESGVESHFFPLPGEPYFVHMMHLDRITGVWTEIAAKAIPAGVSSSTTAVLRDKIVYLAYADAQGDAFELVVLDTSNGQITDLYHVPVAPKPVAVLGIPSTTDNASQRIVLCTTQAIDAGAPAPSPAPAPAPLEAGQPDLGAGGEGGVADDGGAADGSIPIEAGNGDDAAAPARPEGGAGAGAAGGGGAGAAAAAGTPATLTPYLLQPDAPPVALDSQTVKPIGPLVGFTTVMAGGSPQVLVVARSPRAGDAGATVTVYDPSMQTMLAGTFGFNDFNDFNVQLPAFSPCDGYAFVVGTNVDTKVYGVDLSPLFKGDTSNPALTSVSQTNQFSGQGLYFEPYMKTVLAPFSQGASFTLNAFAVGTTKDGAIALNRRTDWASPADLRVNFLAVKSPGPACPASAP